MLGVRQRQRSRGRDQTAVLCAPSVCLFSTYSPSPTLFRVVRGAPGFRVSSGASKNPASPQVYLAMSQCIDFPPLDRSPCPSLCHALTRTLDLPAPVLPHFSRTLSVLKSISLSPPEQLKVAGENTHTRTTQLHTPHSHTHTQHTHHHTHTTDTKAHYTHNTHLHSTHTQHTITPHT